VATQNTLNESKTLDLNGGLMKGGPSTFRELKYTVTVSLPANDLTEAKRNCGKLTYLTRMFFKKVNDSELSDGLDSTGQYGESDQEEEKTKVSLNQRRVRVYIPHMIESPKSTFGRPPNTDHVKMEKNALPLYFENLSFDVNLEQGFFEDEGMLYPKNISIQMEFFHNSGDLIKNYNYNASSLRPYTHRESTAYKGKEHFFPYNRKTVILGDP